MLKIKTNGHARPVLMFVDLDADQRMQFNILGDEVYDARFFVYRGSVYDMHDFVVIESAANPAGMRQPFAHVVFDPGSPLLKWGGIATDSAFTGVVVRFATDWDGSLDPEHVVVGYAMDLS